MRYNTKRSRRTQRVKNIKTKKSVVKEAFEGVAQTVSEKATTAFESIKKLLPKTEVSNKLVLMYAAAGAVILGLIGYMMKKKEN